MHLAALPPIYVSGTSRTNFGNNRTGSDRMSTGCPPGILDTVLPPLQPEALPAEPILLPPLFFFPHVFPLFVRQSSSSSFAFSPPFRLLFSLCFLLFFFFFFVYFPYIRVYRESTLFETTSNFHILSARTAIIKFNCRQKREIILVDDKR